MKAGSEKLPAWFREHIICWYSPKRQDATNGSLATDPRLIDLSGKGRDMELVNFQDNKVAADGALYFNSNGIAICDKGFTVSDFTCLLDRSIVKRAYLTTLFSKWDQDRQELPILGIATSVDNNGEMYSFGRRANTGGVASPRKVDVLTPTLYNDRPFIRGQVTDVESAKLVLGGSRWNVDTKYRAVMNLYNFFLFDKTLTQEQIEYVINTLID